MIRLITIILLLSNSTISNASVDNGFISPAFHFNKQELGDDLIYASPLNMLKANDGSLWFAFDSFVIRKQGWRVTRFKLPLDSSQYASAKPKVHIVEYKNQLIFSYKNTLLTHNKESDTLVEWDQVYKNDATITDLLVSQDGRLWISTLKSVQYLNDNILVPITQLNDSYANSLYEDKSGNIWIGTYLASIYKIAPSIEKEATSLLEMYQINSNAPAIINSLLETETNKLLIGTSLGLFEFDSIKKSFKQINNPKQITNVSQIKQEGEVIWLLAKGEIWLSHSPNKNFYKIDTKINLDLHSEKALSKSLYIDDEKNIWVSMQNAGIYYHSPFRNRLSRVIPPQSIDLAQDIFLLKKDITDGFIIADSRKTFISSDESALLSRATAYYKQDNSFIYLATGKSLYVINNEKNISKINLPGRFYSDITSITGDANNNLWLTSDLGGLQRFKLNGEQYEEISIDEAKIGDALFVTHNHNHNHELIIYSPFKISSYRVLADSLQLVEQIILDNEIIKIQQKENYLFAFHSDQSISRLNLINKRLTKHFFNIDNIGCVYNNGDNLWWLSQTNGSVFQFNELNKELREFNNFDGLPGGGVNGELCESYNNEIYFSSYQGLIKVAANINVFNQVKPKANLVIFTQDDRKLVLTNENKTYQLTHTDFPIKIAFYQSSTLSSDKSLIKYKLSGYPENWINLDNKIQEVTYQELASGNHTISIQAFNNDGLASEIKQITLTIIPKVWFTWWAISIYLLSFLIGLYAFYKLRVKTIENNAAQLKLAVKQKTTELAQEKRLVEKLLDKKQQEISSISHEFRTPLTLIIGPLEQLLNTPNLYTAEYQTQTKEKLSLIKRNTYRLLRMVEQLLQIELLKFSQIDHLKSQDTFNIITFIVKSFQYLALKKNISLEIEHLEKAILDFTPDAFEKIMINLISNAVKYTNKGGVISISSAINGEQQLEIKVMDNGIGIPKNKTEIIFERFQRATEEQQIQIEGAGIGLALVKELVDAHQGKIRLQSELGKGTQITLTFPIKVQQNQELGFIPNKDLIENELINLSDSITEPSPLITTSENSNQEQDKGNKTSILIVEDNVEMQNYIIESLNSEHFCYVANNGFEGFELAEKFIPDIIISDVMMPKMDGFELTEKLKNHPTTNHIPIILLTALNDHKSRLEGLSKKADDYLVKPFDAIELNLRLNNLLEIRELLKSKFLESALSKNHDIKETIKHSDNEQEFVFIENLNKVIETHYKNSETKVADIASAVYMSERQLLRKTQGILNISPAEYLRRYRLDQAKILIINGESPGNVALEVGFSSHTHFGKCFKVQYGCSPSDYILQHN